MRDIKFRAWDKIKKRMVSWDEMTSLNNPKKEFYISSLSAAKRYNWSQYIGLKDKNGKEIYEGDIYDYLGEIGVIESIKNLYFQELMEYRINDGKIIGNKYENPELMKTLS